MLNTSLYFFTISFIKLFCNNIQENVFLPKFVWGRVAMNFYNFIISTYYVYQLLFFEGWLQVKNSEIKLCNKTVEKSITR